MMDLDTDVLMTPMTVSQDILMMEQKQDVSDMSVNVKLVLMMVQERNVSLKLMIVLMDSSMMDLEPYVSQTQKTVLKIGSMMDQEPNVSLQQVIVLMVTLTMDQDQIVSTVKSLAMVNISMMAPMIDALMMPLSADKNFSIMEIIQLVSKTPKNVPQTTLMMEVEKNASIQLELVMLLGSPMRKLKQHVFPTLTTVPQNGLMMELERIVLITLLIVLLVTLTMDLIQNVSQDQKIVLIILRRIQEIQPVFQCQQVLEDSMQIATSESTEFNNDYLPTFKLFKIFCILAYSQFF